MIKLMMVGFFSIGIDASQLMNKRFEKKTILSSFREVKCL